MISLKWFLPVLTFNLLLSCSSREKKEGKLHDVTSVREDLVGNTDSLTSELKRIHQIASNITNPKDSLSYLAESAGGITIDSLGKEAWIINMWYGGSYEDILVYTKTKTGSYTRTLSLHGAISFQVESKTDHGLKRFRVKNNRNQKSVVFRYDGKDYSNFTEKGIQKSLKDSVGVNSLKKLEIYSDAI